MSLFIFLLILVSVLLSVAAQIFLKHGMSHISATEGLNHGVIPAVFTILSNLSVLAGLTAYVTSAAVWLVVLSKLDVSKAYPFVGLGFILTMLFAYFFLNEPITYLKVIGTIFVFVGIVLISAS